MDPEGRWTGVQPPMENHKWLYVSLKIVVGTYLSNGRIFNFRFFYIAFKLCSALILKTPFNTFANRADPDQTALVRAARAGPPLFAYGNMIRYDPTPVALTRNCFVLYTNVKVYLYNC